MKSPRQGHRTIAYMGGILHIGGSDKTKIERWVTSLENYTHLTLTKLRHRLKRDTKSKNRSLL